MNELTGTPRDAEVSQGSHHSIYLKNIIGSLVGASNGVTFDRHTNVLYDKLVERERNDVLKIFFKYVTPESFVDEIVRVVNEDLAKNKELLKPFIKEEFWDEGETQGLSRRGALSLLKELHYLENR